MTFLYARFNSMTNVLFQRFQRCSFYFFFFKVTLLSVKISEQCYNIVAHLLFSRKYEQAFSFHILIYATLSPTKARSDKLNKRRHSYHSQSPHPLYHQGNVLYIPELPKEEKKIKKSPRLYHPRVYYHFPSDPPLFLISIYISESRVEVCATSYLFPNSISPSAKTSLGESGEVNPDRALNGRLF